MLSKYSPEAAARGDRKKVLQINYWETDTDIFKVFYEDTIEDNFICGCVSISCFIS